MKPKTRQDVEFMRILASTAVRKREREQRQEQERLQAEVDHLNRQQMDALNATIRRQQVGALLGVNPDGLSLDYCNDFLRGFHGAGH